MGASQAEIGKGLTPDRSQDSTDRGADAPPTKDERGTRLDRDWVLPKAWGDWALAEYPQWTPDKVRSEATKFRDHWVAVSGKDGTKRDWLATWRNWCRNPLAHRDDPRPAAGEGAKAQRNAAAKKRVGFAPAPAQEVIDG